MKKRMIVFLTALLLWMLLAPFSALAEEKGETIRVGWIPRTGIMEVEDGVYSGYNYDFLMEVARYTGWQYTFVEGDADTLLAMLKNGEIDLMCSLPYSEEHLLACDFAELSYGDKYTILFTTKSSPLKGGDYEAYNGMRIGMLKADSESLARLERFAKGVGFSFMSQGFSDAGELVSALHAGQIDACVSEFSVLGPEYRILSEFAPIPYYFAAAKGNTDIMNALNRALYHLDRDHPYIERELFDKHFGVEFDVSLTAEERALVEASKKEPVHIGVIPSSAPACYWDEERGEYVGIFMEMLKVVSQKTGLVFDYQPLDLSQGPPIAQLKAGATDLVAGVVKTERFLNDPELALSDMLLSDSLVLVTRKNNNFTQDAKNAAIACPAGFQVAEEYLKETFPEHPIAAYATAEDCLDAVADGEVSAAIYTRTCINYFLHDPHYDQLEFVQAYSRDMESCAAALSPDQSALVSIVNKGLAMISESERNDIMMNTTIMNPYRITLIDLLYKYRIPVLIICLLLLLIIAAAAAMNVNRRRNRKRLLFAYEQEKAALALAERASAAKGNFMSRMSHEIRTPLNAVIGYITIARSEMNGVRNEAERRQSEMKVMDCLLKSDMASKHLLTIINDVLDMSAIESGRIVLAQERFDFRGMISSLSTLFYSQARAKGVRLEVALDSVTEEWFVGDQMRVSQILTNLLSNAVKFTPAGGAVRLTIRQSGAPENKAHVHFEISDTGIGMSPAYLQHIWTPFEQADASISRRFGGTGLGLSITKSLVDLMGGTITVESEPDHGSCFFVDLNFARANQPRESAAYDFSGVHALVVDDDESTCDYIRLLFSRCAARCYCVTSGAAALSEVAVGIERHDPYTVCLVDWRMPEMDGVETVRRMRELAGKDLPIIVITAYDFSEIAEQAEQAGVSMFLAKPLFQSTLFDLLVNISGKSKPGPAVKSVTYDFAGARVLLVEDNAMNMEIARRILESASLVVDSAWNGQEAVDMFTAAPAGTYQAILMDVQMPVMDGHQAARTIRDSAHPEARSIPIIAMTADAFAENVAESLASGMNGHISKPIDLPTLFSTLRTYISEKGRGSCR